MHFMLKEGYIQDTLVSCLCCVLSREKAGTKHTKVSTVFKFLDVVIMGFYSEFSKFPM